MFGLSSCTVYGRKEVKSGTAILTKNNSARAKTGSKIVLVIPGKELYLVVGNLVSGDDITKDNITVSTDDGVSGAVSGQYRIIADFPYSRNRAFGSRKAKLSALYTFMSIFSAAAASVAASQKEHCTALDCVKWYTWCLIGISAALSVLAWYKDNVV
jgi:hypothetical protein